MAWLRKPPLSLPISQTDLQDRLFWVRFLAAGIDFLGCNSFEHDRRLADRPTTIDRVSLEFPANFELVFTVGAWGHEIQLAHPRLTDPTTLGWMNSHQVSDVFRKSEFESLDRCVQASRNHRLAPWMSRLLLGFYVSPLREYQDWYLPMLRATVMESEMFSENEASWIVEYTSNVLRDDFQWTFDQKLGWLASGSDSYSLRSVGNPQFPFMPLRHLLELVVAEA